MGITHVIRGDDHLSNTPRQILIYEALGAAVPTFAHLSMILGPDGHKLSKRHGATSVEEYRDRGYLPDAMVNFLALLGWSKDGETTILSRDELCAAFDLDRITKKDAIFDETKLDWMNGVYIRDMGAKAWVGAAGPWLARAVAAGRAIEPGAHIAEDVLCTDRRTASAHAPEDGSAARGARRDAPNSVDASEKTDGEAGMCDPTGDEALERARSFVHENACELERLYPLVSERLARLDQIPEKLAFLFWGPHVALDAKSVKKVLLKESAHPREALSVCRAVLADEGMPWECDALQSACRARGEERGIKPRNLFQPLRVAVCGNMVSPPLFESIELLERADVLARIDGTIDAVYGK